MAIFALLGLFLLSRLVNLSHLPLFLDETIYLRWLNSISQTNDWLLPLKEFGWEPLSIWVAAGMNWFVKDGLLSLRLTAGLFGLLTLICLWLALKPVFQSRAVYLISLTYLLSPIILLHDRLGLRGDSAVSFCFSLSLLGLIQRLIQKKTASAYLISLAIILGLLIKSTAVIIPLIVFISFIVFKPKISKHDLTALALTPLPLVFYYFTHTLSLVVNKSSVFVNTGSWLIVLKDNLLQLCLWLYQYLTWPVVLLFMIGLFLLFKQQRQLFKLLLISFLVSFIFIAVTAKILFPRYILLSFVCALIISGYGLSAILDQLPKLFKPLTVVFLLPGLIISYKIITDLKTARLPEIERWQYVTGWPSGYALPELISYLKISPPEILVTEENDLIRTGLPYLWPDHPFIMTLIPAPGAYFVANINSHLPDGLTGRLVKEFPRPDNKSALTLWQLE